MAKLNHVCIWEETHWRRVSAEEASKLFPDQTVSSGTRLFICELCGQGVTLTNGPKRVRYFRHSRGEADKSCPERSENTGYETFENGSHGLPIKIIVNHEGKYFHFELGLIPVPEHLLDNAKNDMIVIAGADEIAKSRFSLERVNPERVTYLNVGAQPSGVYHLKTDSVFKEYWPETVPGITDEGCLFDGLSGKLLIKDSEVTVNRPYYFLLRKGMPIPYAGEDMELRRLFEYKDYRLYSFSCLKYSSSAAIFLWKYGYRLTDSPIAIQPIWPPCQEMPYTVRHGGLYTWFFVSGENNAGSGSGVQTRVFPDSDYHTFYKDGITLLKVACTSTRRLISAGRYNVLTYRYSYYRKLHQKVDIPKVSVSDLKGEILSEGESNHLPRGNVIYIRAPYDGCVLVKRQQIVQKRLELKSEVDCSIDRIQFGETVEVYQGLDCVYKVTFRRKQRKKNSSEDEMYWLKRLEHCSGSPLPAGRDILYAASRLKGYPCIGEWLKQQARKGFVAEDALKIIRHLLLRK